MNLQDAYKKLDLAKGLDEARVKNQYEKLKEDLLNKLSSIKSEKLKQVYTNRLQEVEDSYTFLLNHFNGGGELTENEKTENLNQQNTEFSKSNNKSSHFSKKSIIYIVVLFFIFSLSLIYFIGTGFFSKEKIDLFRKIDGEVNVFVNNLTLRQYPDSKSAKIELFPFGTRLIFEENEPAKKDEKNRTWRKVRVIHPVYGWDRPDENFPYPYEGWMAVEECGTSWVEDSTKTADLNKIFGNEFASISITSNYRHALLDYFTEKKYFDSYQIYGAEKNDKYKSVLLANFENSESNCNDEKQMDLVALLESKDSKSTGKRRLLVMSLNAKGEYKVAYDEEVSGINGFRKLSNKEKEKQESRLYYDCGYFCGFVGDVLRFENVESHGNSAHYLLFNLERSYSEDFGEIREYTEYQIVLDGPFR